MAPYENLRMSEAMITENGTTIEDNKQIDPHQDVEDSYLNGLVVFKTKIVWTNVIFFIVLHIMAIYGVYVIAINERFIILSIAVYYLALENGYGITIGAHRLWTHKCFKAKRPLRVILMILQSAAGQNSLHTWILDHRQHHKYADTDADPHNAKRGLFFSHMGWLMTKKHPLCKRTRKNIYMADIEADPVVMFQKKHLTTLHLIFGILVPTLIYQWMAQSTLYQAICINFLKYIVTLHFTWTVNSLAHVFGNKPYDKSIMPTENRFVALLTAGEGWHNYHHAFPWDYKAAEFGRDFNMSAKIIRFCERIGWAYDLKEASYDVVMKTIYRKGDGSHELAEDVVSQKNSEIKHPTPGIEQLSMGW